MHPHRFNSPRPLSPPLPSPSPPHTQGLLGSEFGDSMNSPPPSTTSPTSPASPNPTTSPTTASVSTRDASTLARSEGSEVQSDGGGLQGGNDDDEEQEVRGRSSSKGLKNSATHDKPATRKKLTTLIHSPHFLPPSLELPLPDPDQEKKMQRLERRGRREGRRRASPK